MEHKKIEADYFIDELNDTIHIVDNNKQPIANFYSERILYSFIINCLSDECKIYDYRLKKYV